MTAQSSLLPFYPQPNSTAQQAFQSAVNEVYNNLIACGLSVQTSDTGQIAAPYTGELPFVGPMNIGYYMFKFNDTLQATKPVFIKLEFGWFSVNAFEMWITVGTAWSANGVIDNGCVLTLGSFSGGTGWNGGAAGTFQVFPAGGSGTGLGINLTLNSSGVPVSGTIFSCGNGYKTSDSLNLTSANIVSAGGAAGGSGTCSFQPASVSSGLIGNQRAPVLSNSLISNNFAAYTSFFCYNSTYGLCGMAWKQLPTNAYCYGGFLVWRSNNVSTGAATGDCVTIMAHSFGGQSPSGSGAMGAMVSLSYLTSALVPALPSTLNTMTWTPSASGFPMNAFMTYSTVTGFCNAIPLWIRTPAIQETAYVGLAIASEVPIGATVTTAISGAGLSLTFMSVGAMFGASLSLGQSVFANPPGSTILMLFQ